MPNMERLIVERQIGKEKCPIWTHFTEQQIQGVQPLIARHHTNYSPAAIPSRDPLLFHLQLNKPPFSRPFTPLCILRLSHACLLRRYALNGCRFSENRKENFRSSGKQMTGQQRRRVSVLRDDSLVLRWTHRSNTTAADHCQDDMSSIR